MIWPSSDQKRLGEPPLMYGIGAYFAIRNAVLAFNPHSDILMTAPITPEKVLMGFIVLSK